MKQETELPLEVISALEQGRKIKAIKLLREGTGLGLKEAKDEVERYLREHPQSRSRFQSAAAESNRHGLLWLMLAAAVLLSFMLFGSKF